MTPLEENLKLCEEIQNLLAKLSDSDFNHRDTWLKIGDLETKMVELKMLYKQII